MCKTSGNTEGITSAIAAFDDNLSEVDPDPKQNRIGVNVDRLIFSMPPVNLDRTGDGSRDASKHRKYTVARLHDYLARLGGNRGGDEVL